ncbi:MAG: EscU/YscU/HrcU family type III secretion system export apparatus switch protein [Desulfuromonas sp.]|jgi:flagellar biosynthesis protein|nr:EscU/YscU/HrcU family type III secretion system export apparatus switch protein [Desulfuromonas thiophila]
MMSPVREDSQGSGVAPLKRAVAIRYDRDQADAPVVVASGQGQVAERIIALAIEAGLPITSDPDLTELLAKIPLGAEIPVELYQAVAEVLAYVYRLNGTSAR